ncbi:hypothetical protein JXK06_00135 [Patescibacteria group bacterium]|nr:hypothetical protein [Patescibacteria group bacterium]
MKNFLFFLKDKKNKTTKSGSWLLLVFCLALVFSVGFLKVQSAWAQPIPVVETASIPETVSEVKRTLWQKLSDALKKAGSIAFNRTLQSSLNKIAYDAANYIGAGASGQKPLFNTEDFGTYMKKIGDEAGGEFLETFVRNLDTSGSDSNDSCAERLDSCLTECYRLVHQKDPIDTESLMFFRDGLPGAYVGVDGEGIASGQACVKQCELGNTSCASSAEKGFAADTGSDLNSFNVCQPSSIEVKLKISLGLVEQNRPTGPNCTATEAINSWGDDINKKLASLSDGEFLKNIDNIFDPRANDLGIYFLARTDMTQNAAVEVDAARLQRTESGGWLDVRDIAGFLEGVPGAAREAEADARAIRIENFGKTTGDIFVDAANLFLNQLAVSAYNNIMRTLADKKADAGSSLVDAEADPNISGASSMREKTRVLIETNFGSKADYSVLSELSICPDPSNPGPNNCVIDDRFMQAIIEEKTVGEAIKEGYLNPNWKVEKDVFASAYTNHYSLRNVKILRKYRIVPLAWELAIEKAFEDKANKKNVTFGDLVACFSEDDDFDQFSANFQSSNTSWCQGLVDPNWVLKAPLNYCGQSGNGSYILNMTMVPTSSGEEDLVITRSDDYCADNQSCIKENKDGGCDLYGYCTEDRRTWNFESNSCSPINNTCQTFSNTIDGTTASYLENTLDYGDCNADSAGCRRYSLSGNYNDNGSISWNFSDNIFFNKNLVSCNAQNEGCSELMRVKPTWGFNLLIDSAFNFLALGQTQANNKIGPWSLFAGSKAEVILTTNEVPDVNNNSRAIKISGVNGSGFQSNEDVFPKDLEILAEQNYTLSADIFLVSGTRVEMKLNPGDRQVVGVVNQSGDWERISVTTNSNEGFFVPRFSFSGFGSSVEFYVKNIKFELADRATSYSVYGQHVGLNNSLLPAHFNQKLLPSYLHKTCYVDAVSASKDYTLKDNAPSVCFNYARQCNYSEVGCQLFTNTYDGFQTAAQVTSADYCAGECVGYDVYIAKENYFNPTEAQNLIPSLATQCAQSAVGCNEFTNLDEVARGGEGKEYYSELKQCIKPDPSKCANFYTWESSSQGYQIKTYNLQKDENGDPLVNFGDEESADCSDIFGLPVSDPRYNPDCREFRNTAGQVSYRLISRVITCSDNCFSYRLSGNNIHPSAKTQAECNNSMDETYWNASNSTCLTCLNGGKWDTNQNACVYQAIPGEGKSCQSTQVGCREYNGNRGNDVRLVASYDFENGLGAWYGNCNNGIELSPIANNQTGNSLLYNSSATPCEPAGGEKLAKINIGSSIQAGRAYSLKFLARSDQTNTLKIYFENSLNGDKYFFNSSSDVEKVGEITINGGNEWTIYQLNLENVPEALGINGSLNISANYDFYLDDILLTEISNRYYFIKDSINIPDVCYYDNLGNYQGGDYNLGCSQYKDKDNYTHNLHNFTKLCSSSSAGCEQMITTNNYASPEAKSWNLNNLDQSCEVGDEGCLTVERDSVVYVVYDQTKACLSDDIGCSRLGEGLGSGTDTSWSDTFKLNNPNTYNETLCVEGDLGCEEYRDVNNGGLSYFRNPANNLCVYRSSSNPEIPGKAWYKIPVKRCDLNSNGLIDGSELGGTICSSNSSCSSGNCIVDNNDYNCSVSYLKTIGYGGVGAIIPVPDESVALCDSVAAGCTEYIDPISKFNPNLVANPNYLNSNIAWGDGFWQGEAISNNSQIINFERNKMYSLRAFNSNTAEADFSVELNFIGDVRILRADNSFSEPLKVVSPTTTDNPVIFNSLGNYSALLKGGRPGLTIEVRELAVEYNIKEEVDDSSCNGLLDFDTGCILFNERSVAGASGLEINKFNALASIDGKAPVSSDGPYNANKLLKVKPDRTCASWLTCTSYVLDDDGSKICSSIAECNLLDDKNECANFVVRPATEKLVFDAETNRNASGYAIAGNYYFNNIKEVGLNTSARYDFEDDIPALSCVQANSAGTPLFNSFCTFDQNIIKDTLISEPGLIGNLARGKTYLKVSSFQAISPQAAGSYVVLPEAGDYYLSYLVNTKNSNTAAKVIITDNNNKILENLTITSPDGWERKVNKITTTTDNVGIRIYLSLITPSSERLSLGPVYFDDINIETVLEVAEDDYRTRDCRLYPTSSSFGCQEVNNAVVRNGLEGYCLEYDLANPSVCQLWMPIDRIAAAKINSNQLGYNGKYPLSYCAEVSSNFIFLEKRVAAIVKEESIRRNDDEWLDKRTCYYPSSSTNTHYCAANFTEGNTTIYFDVPQTGTIGTVSTSGEVNSETETVYTFDPETMTSTTTTQTTGVQDLEITEREPTGYLGEEVACITSDHRDGVGWKGACVDHYEIIAPTGGEYDIVDPGQVSNNCGDSGNYFLLVASDLKQENGFLKRDDVAITSICMPIQNTRSSSTSRYVAVSNDPIKTYDGVKSIRPLTDGWYLADGFHNVAGQVGDKRDGSPAGFDELYNANPPLRVLDLNYPTPTAEEDLKKISSNDSDEVFRLTCNRFVEAVSGSGDNMAWVERVSPNSSYKILSTNGVTYNNYIRKLGDIPFGAASWPTDFNLAGSERVTLYNQYSAKNKEEIFAGRPYGCEINGETDANCARIGYCSANPDVYCLLDTTGWFSDKTYDIARHSCGSFGKCQPLWGDNIQNLSVSSEGALKQIFAQAPVAYRFQASAGGYISEKGYYNSTTGNLPTISNIKLYIDDTNTEVLNGAGLKAGNYRLEFNSSIDPNKQPLKEIFIDWGDGFKQVITGEDEKGVTSDTAHRFYHFYSTNRANGATRINVRVYDNWGVSSATTLLNR